jgi:hypothetical protein
VDWLETVVEVKVVAESDAESLAKLVDGTKLDNEVVSVLVLGVKVEVVVDVLVMVPIKRQAEKLFICTFYIVVEEYENPNETILIFIT